MTAVPIIFCCASMLVSNTTVMHVNRNASAKLHYLAYERIIVETVLNYL